MPSKYDVSKINMNSKVCSSEPLYFVRVMAKDTTVLLECKSAKKALRAPFLILDYLIWY